MITWERTGALSRRRRHSSAEPDRRGLRIAEDDFIEALTFADADAIMVMIRETIPDLTGDLPVWARNLAFRLAFLQRPDDAEFLRAAAADLDFHGPGVPHTVVDRRRPNQWQTAVMPSEAKSWTIKHFTQANPVGPGQDSVPALLRRIADSIEQRPGIEVQDVILHNEVTADGDWWSATVYFHDRPL